MQLCTTKIFLGGKRHLKIKTFCQKYMGAARLRDKGSAVRPYSLFVKQLRDGGYTGAACLYLLV